MTVIRGTAVGVTGAVVVAVSAAADVVAGM
jgi:hypothetical protein